MDPWVVGEQWTWPQFWRSVHFVRERAEGARRAQRAARVKAGLEKPGLADVFRGMVTS